MPVFIGEVELEVPETNTGDELGRFASAPVVMPDHQRPDGQYLTGCENPVIEQAQLSDSRSASEPLKTMSCSSSLTSGANTPVSASLQDSTPPGEHDQSSGFRPYSSGRSDEIHGTPCRSNTRQIYSPTRMLHQGPHAAKFGFARTAEIFFHEHSDPIDRLHALKQAIHMEVDKLFPHIDRPEASFGYTRAVTDWKEEMFGRLITEIIPAIGSLNERVSRKTATSMRQQQAGVRLS